MKEELRMRARAVVVRSLGCDRDGIGLWRFAGERLVLGKEKKSSWDFSVRRGGQMFHLVWYLTTSLDTRPRRGICGKRCSRFQLAGYRGFGRDLIANQSRVSENQRDFRDFFGRTREMEYDGIVLETWSRWARYGVLHDPEMRKMALEFIKRLGQEMHSVNSVKNASHHLELIYVIPAPHSQNLAEYDFGPQDLQELSDSIDGLSLMTYDFSGPQNPGPNAPLSWIHSSMQLLLGGNNEGGLVSHAHMIFLGMNLYGNDFVLSEAGSGGAIIGRDYLSLLEKHRPVLRWDEKSAEHFFIYSHDNLQHVVFYPSLKSISMRMDEARAWGAGLSLWEIGQGLDYFYELL